MSNPVLDAVHETMILVNIRTKAVGLNCTDKNASFKVNNDHNAVHGAGKVVVNRLAGADNLHKQIVSCQNKAGALLKDMSMPFGEDIGWRMQANADLEPFVRELNPIKQEFEGLREQVKVHAPEIVATVEQSKGSYNIRVPTVDELVNGYDMQVDFRPIPNSANFTGLNPNTIAKLKAMHDTKLEAAVYAAERNTLERFVDPVNNFVKGLTAYEKRLERMDADPDDKKRDGTFRDTLVTNIKDLHDRLNSFNISGDPRLTQLGNELASIVNVDPKQLRQDPVVRSAAMDRAQEVANNLKGWLGHV